ncbi:MAG TPA: TonB-dependent siderophore receptor [Nostocaceae cyanobacterium]|nr:TonB-dependent siderophore receptor [Nostocaceae cyanobacterium]
MNNLAFIDSLALASIFLSIFSISVESAQAEIKQPATDKNLSVNTSHEIQSLSEREIVFTEASLLLTQTERNNSPVKITGWNTNQTTGGMELILETDENKTLSLPFTQHEGNNLTVNIPNAILDLPDTQPVKIDHPITGITEISFIQNSDNSVKIIIIGKENIPEIQITPSKNRLVLSIIPVTNNADIELSVVSTPVASYSLANTATISKTDIPLRNLPFAVQVIPQQLIQDQRVQNIGEAVRNNGFAFSGRGGGRNESSFLKRGFTADQFRDGFSENNNSNRAFTEISNLEQIEILKGPASGLYGQSEPGGIVNLVTKKPLLESYYLAEYIGGSFGLNRGNLDLTAPLNRSSSYRLNIADESANSFREGVESKRFFIAPKFAFNLSPKTKLSLFTEYLEDSRPIDFGLVAVGNTVADIPISRFLGDPSRKNDVYQRRGYIFLDHNFSDNWSLRSAFRTTSSDQDFAAIFARGTGLQRDNQTLLLQAQNSDQSSSTDTLQTNLVGKFTTGTIKHNALIGFEWGNEARSVVTENTNAGSINIFRPVYRFTLGRFNKTIDRREETNLFGFYLQDEIALADNLKILLGGRFDTVDFTLQDNLRRVKETNYSEAFSPQIGIIYQPIQPISLYANFSRSFVPQSGSSFDGQPFKPETGTQYEIGIKGDWFNGRLSSTLAFYEITKNNVLTTDTNRPTFSIQTGEQRSRGIELDVVGEILPGWNVIASYAYTDAEITSDTTFPVGNQLANVPQNTFSLWTTYTINSGDLQGLGFGTGIFTTSDRPGDLNNSFTLPSYTRVDAAIYYNYNNFRAALNIKNLFDTRYFESAQSRTGIFSGTPLTVVGTVSLQF